MMDLYENRQTVIEEDAGKNMVDNLKEHLANTPKEELEREFFEIRCEYEGIDPNDEDAKRKLWWKDTKKELRIVSHYLGHYTLKTLILVFAWLSGIFAVYSIHSDKGNLWYILFLLCIIGSSALLDVYMEHDEEWFFLRKKNKFN